MLPNPQFPADLVTFTEEMLNGKLHFSCSVFFPKKNVMPLSLMPLSVANSNESLRENSFLFENLKLEKSTLSCHIKRYVIFVYNWEKVIKFTWPDVISWWLNKYAQIIRGLNITINQYHFGFPNLSKKLLYVPAGMGGTIKINFILKEIQYFGLFLMCSRICKFLYSNFCMA